MDKSLVIKYFGSNFCNYYCNSGTMKGVKIPFEIFTYRDERDTREKENVKHAEQPLCTLKIFKVLVAFRKERNIKKKFIHEMTLGKTICCSLPFTSQNSTRLQNLRCKSFISSQRIFLQY